MKIINPVLRGFFSDPSIVRVGSTYYIATSTFEWWPGVRLNESTDLVHWRPLPSPLTRVSQLDLRGTPSGGGIWAPDLSYADGRFWLVYTDVKIVDGAFKDCTNYLTVADDIRGPWSEPHRLNGVGFDASLFHDGDGRKYLVQQTWDFREDRHAFNGITLTELDTATLSLKPETERRIWAGTDVKLTEGPHLYRKDGWYYLFCAEGGTQYEHQESVARSRTLDADSFAVMPGGPFIGNYTTPESPLQKQGHGALVSTPSGEWYYASLCARPWRHATEPSHGVRGWCTLGRETSLQKVYWDEDDWPRVEGGPAGRLEVEAPRDAIEMEGVPADASQHDDFTGSSLALPWCTPRVPFTDRMGTVGGGALTLYGQGSPANAFDLSLVARRWQAFDFDAEVRLDFHPKTYRQMAGLTNYYNDHEWTWIYLTWDEDRQAPVLLTAEYDFGRLVTHREAEVVLPEGTHQVWLRTQVRTGWYTYSYSLDCEHWHGIPVRFDAAHLSDDYIAQRYGGFFTGAFVGLMAVDLSGYRTPARFASFDYRELSADPRPEEQHDQRS